MTSLWRHGSGVYVKFTRAGAASTDRSGPELATPNISPGTGKPRSWRDSGLQVTGFELSGAPHRQPFEGVSRMTSTSKVLHILNGPTVARIRFRFPIRGSHVTNTSQTFHHVDPTIRTSLVA